MLGEFVLWCKLLAIINYTVYKKKNKQTNLRTVNVFFNKGVYFTTSDNLTYTMQSKNQALSIDLSKC